MSVGQDQPATGSTEPPAWVGTAVRRGAWTVVGVVLLTLAALWFASQARNLIRILIVSQLLAFALEPGVIWLHEKRGWRRGSGTGAILAATFVGFTLLIVLMIPVLANGVNGIVRSIPHWIDQLNGFWRDHFHATLVSSSGLAGTSKAASNVNDYLKEHAGDLVGAAGGVLGAVFNIFTIALFTFYLTAKGPEVRRALLSRMRPERQERALFAIEEAIRKMGGYLYSRGLLAIINGALLLIVLLIIGTPYALPIALFAGIVAEFIPIVGTYLAGAVPVVVTLASVGTGGAIVVIAEIVIYQAIENYWLSPHISEKTMELNAGIAFGAAMAGGAVGGFIGAFFALPIAAVVQSFLSTYSRRYDVPDTELTRVSEPPPPKPPREHRRLVRGRRAAGAEGPLPPSSS
jgi:predicted PurR-regulated permease PerM